MKAFLKLIGKNQLFANQQRKKTHDIDRTF